MQIESTVGENRTNTKKVKIKKFDLILVYGFVREDLFFISIIKELSKKYQIGLLLSDEKKFYSKPENKTFAKVKETGGLMRDLCVKYGAEKIYINEFCECNLLLIHPCNWYTDDYIQKFKKNISFKKIIGMFFHNTFNANYFGLPFLTELKCKHFFVHMKSNIKEIFKENNKSNSLDDLFIKECGFPFNKYPIIESEKLKIDYLIAMPSLSHFGDSNRGKKMFEFFYNVIKLTRKIPASDLILIKHHNVSDQVKNSKIKIKNIKWEMVRMFFYCTFAKLAMFKEIKNKLYNRSAQSALKFLESKYLSLEEITKYHNFNIEVFLPHVRKGIITGHSGTVFHALFSKVPIYNCDPQHISWYKSNYLEEFQVKFCNGNLKFDEKYFELIPEKLRQLDIVELVENELIP